MKYKIEYDEKVFKTLSKLPRKTAQRISAKIESTTENPFFYFQKLTNRPEFKLRVGEYRIIADIKRQTLLILILYIAQRKKVYKKL